MGGGGVHCPKHHPGSAYEVEKYISGILSLFFLILCFQSTLFDTKILQWRYILSKLRYTTVYFLANYETMKIFLFRLIKRL